MATKARRPVAMATPPPQSKARSVYSEEEKRGLLDNFDLEVADKTRSFHATLSATLASFLTRQETEILKLPRELRAMKLGDLQAKWDGSFAGTLQRITRERFEEREREEAAKVTMEQVKGKRKRGTGTASNASSPIRNAKNAKTAAATEVLTASSSKRRPAASTSKRTKPIASSSKGPSSLPQDHIFAPNLPSTPLIPRKARRNESFMSMNGSPIANPYDAAVPSPTHASVGHGDSHSHSQPSRGALFGSYRSKVDDRGAHGNRDDDGEDEVSEGASDSDSDSDLDLPDPEAYEAQVLASKHCSKPSNRSEGLGGSKPSRPKRGPSLFFRQSLTGSGLPGAPAGGESDEEDVDGVGRKLSSVKLSDGRVIQFDPIAVDRAQVEIELAEGGLSEQEKKKARAEIRAKATAALTARLDGWGLGRDAAEHS